SVAALVHGFRSFGEGVWLGGVILNRAGSERHVTILTEALEEIGVPVLGALRRHDAVATPSRHLGLVPVAERSADAVAAVRRFGEVVAAGVDLDAVLALARSAPSLAVDPWSPESAVGTPAGDGRPVVALAAGAAFSFSYAETAELLGAAGATVLPFDPLRDESLPEGASGLVVGGGFPEVYATDLAANEPLRAAVRDAAARGLAVAAECAGLLWLTRSLDGQPMCGVLAADARMTPQLTLGYRDAVALTDSPLAAEGTRVSGHEFHRTVVEPRASERPAWGWRGGQPEGFVAGTVHASYLHLHWAGAPQLARNLVAAATRTAASAR
ncbi:MAG: cobyrinic acid a,c-diamide synthase, partial [Cryptosporangiaceae bacterium]|nr:cobyrinic acid a,c-diamide synthase [Cryptosporangiaceae bacterium]